MRWALWRGRWILAAAGLALALACDDVDPYPVGVGNGFAGSATGSAGSFTGGGTSPISPFPMPGQPFNELCQGPLPIIPLTRLSAVDIDATLDQFFPAGPRLTDALSVPDAGYGRDLSLSFARALRDVARERVSGVVSDAASLEACSEDDSEQPGCLRYWLREWGGKLYRRPLETAQVDAYEAQFASVSAQHGAEQAAANTLTSMLLSPYFVLRIELGTPSQPTQLTPWEVAARLSHFATRRAPDAQLSERASTGKLSTPGELLQELYRLWSLPEGRAARELQHLEWLGVSRPDARPELDADLGADMERQLRALVSDVFDHQGGTLNALLTSSRQMVSERLAVHYGLPPELASEQDFVDWSGTPYAGALSTGAFLTRYRRPTLRGQQILSRFLCLDLQHPASAPATLAEGATPRQRIESSVPADPSCSSCHQMVDPPGFALEAFDDQGRLTGFDSTGAIALQLGVGSTPLDGPRALGGLIAQSSAGMTCAARRYVEYAIDAELTSTTQVRLVAPNPDPPDVAWSLCLSGLLGGRDGSLTRVAEVIVTSALMRQASNVAHYVVASSISADPVEHAAQEAVQFQAAFLAADDVQTLNRYLTALQDLQRMDASPPDPSAGGDGAGGDASDGAGAGPGGADAGGAGGAP